MKCRELMVKDWVANQYGTPIQIYSVGDNGAYANTGDTLWVFEDNEYKPQPIPLTPEILEKNGFIKVNPLRYEYGNPDTDCYVKVNPKKNMMHINGRKANSNLYSHSFVHELQRALRCCGLWDLANNFKV